MNKNLHTQILEINRLMIYDRSKPVNEQLMMPITLTNPWFREPWNYKHEILDVLSITSFFIPFIGPGLSIGLDLLNAKLYYDEGDRAMAGLVAAFAVIPFGELVRMIPGAKNGGIQLITNALQKAKAGRALSKAEQEIIESVITNSSKITRKAKRGFLKKILIDGFKKLTIKQKLAVLYKLVKTIPGMGSQGFGLLNQGVIQIGGILYTYVKLLSIYGIDESEPDLESQKIIESYEDEITEKLIEDIDNLFGSTLEERDEDFADLINTIISEVQNPTNDNTQTNKETKDNNEESKDEIIVTDYDKNWDYKKHNGQYFTKRKTSTNWIKPTGSALEAIKTKVFKD